MQDSTESELDRIQVKCGSKFRTCWAGVLAAFFSLILLGFDIFKCFEFKNNVLTKWETSLTVGANKCVLHGTKGLELNPTSNGTGMTKSIKIFRWKIGTQTTYWIWTLAQDCIFNSFSRKMEQGSLLASKRGKTEQAIWTWFDCKFFQRPLS